MRAATHKEASRGGSGITLGCHILGHAHLWVVPSTDPRYGACDISRAWEHLDVLPEEQKDLAGERNQRGLDIFG